MSEEDQPERFTGIPDDPPINDGHVAAAAEVDGPNGNEDGIVPEIENDVVPPQNEDPRPPAVRNQQIGRVTMIFAGLSLLSLFLTSTNRVSRSDLFFHPTLIFENGELWRLFTSFFMFGEKYLKQLLQLALSCKVMNDIENRFFQQNQKRLLLLLLILCTLITVITLRLPQSMQDFDMSSALRFALYVFNRIYKPLQSNDFYRGSIPLGNYWAILTFSVILYDKSSSSTWVGLLSALTVHYVHQLICNPSLSGPIFSYRDSQKESRNNLDIDISPTRMTDNDANANLPDI
ncbi:hypothetical protein BLNAU_19909 [Blattamonas nauphoetae]|uniref:Derlin n=1 Tax=Blattamonas nauphoetae TaxID=2049346 RepID=A0ABQ9X089_9EUKA|nr:hypothetical protein BLNAU_19909 [Blattamonas nauphoetae]